jgi:hypothetical protein
MKVYKDIGSKERLVEVFQKVNKVKLNEDFGLNLNPKKVLDVAFDDLKNGRLKEEENRVEVNGDQTYVVLVRTDREGNNVTFTFKVDSQEGDQEGVHEISNVELFAFSFDAVDTEESVEMDEHGLVNFNQQHENEMFDLVDGYVDVEEEEPVNTSLYEDAIGLIDKIPYKAGSEQMQTHKQYADEKPTNADVRVKADELEKFVNEEMWDSFDTEAGALSRYNTGRPVQILPASDKNVPDEEDDDDDSGELSQEKVDLIYQAYDNLVAKNKSPRNPNYSPTHNEVMIEANKLVKEKGMKFEENVEAAGVEKSIGKQYDMLPDESERKKAIVLAAQKFVDNTEDWEMRKFQEPLAYKARIKEVAVAMFFDYFGLTHLNESEDSSYSYPEGMGKEFEPDKAKYPRQKKKRKSKKIKLKEDDGMSFDPYADQVEQGVQTADAEKMDDKAVDNELTDVLLGYEPKNVGEEFDYAAAETGYEDKDAHNKYMEYSQKDFDNLSDDEKDEYFELWKQFKGSEK